MRVEGDVIVYSYLSSHLGNIEFAMLMPICLFVSQLFVNCLLWSNLQNLAPVSGAYFSFKMFCVLVCFSFFIVSEFL